MIPQSIFPNDDERSLFDYYGDVGLNQREFIFPYPHYYWENNQPLKGFLCHNKVINSLDRIFSKIFDHYGAVEIRQLRLDIWGGCLYLRSIRDGKRFSTHSWGIAIDFDPINNQLHWKNDKALFAKSEYIRWWEIWEEEGWCSLGRTCNYDWMHVQAAFRI